MNTPFVANDATDLRLVHPEPSSDLVLRDGCGLHATDQVNIRIAKLAGVVSSAAARSRFVAHVSHVVSLGADEQMGRSDTCRDVTGVADFHVAGRGLGGEPPHDSVCVFGGSFGEVKPPIASAGASLPQPTRVGESNTRPESSSMQWSKLRVHREPPTLGVVGRAGATAPSRFDGKL
jgi:hypothetical protein